MSLAKLPRTTVIAGSPAVAYRPYSRSCPSPAPAPVPTPAPVDSGGLVGCVRVPIYGLVPFGPLDPTTGQPTGYTNGIVGYYTVCSG